ncbi:MAG: helix-turn-helix transcriptional regulator [Rhodospirillaceae bacterium]|jgi:transcriptional regulator with XRE-family HTH domain|nr:helix-turn-helix transcriptional regulator [Rhodospirillaceae bacterium]
MTQQSENFSRDQLRVIGRRLRALRVGKGWSLQKLSNDSDTSVSAIRKIEIGQSNPSLLTILAIVTALGEPIDKLVTSARPLEGTIRVTRASETKKDAADSWVQDFELSEGVENSAMSGRLVHLERNSSLKASPGGDTAPVFGFILEGIVSVEHETLGKVRCAAGDSFHMYASNASKIGALPNSDARLILMSDNHNLVVEATST